MWDKLNWFGWGKQKTLQPVQRDVSVTLTNGDKREVIQRSPSGSKMLSTSTVEARQGLDDDESSDGSTSINYGLKVGPTPRRNSYSFSREPLDNVTWSNVTSPGFTSRLVQAAGQNPLKELNDSMSHSPFRKSPYRNLTLGELPYVAGAITPKLPSPTMSSPGYFRSGASSSMYNRERRKHARQGQVFVRIAPIDPLDKTNMSLNRSSASPASSGRFSPRDGPRGPGEPYRNEGLGGIPQHELNMRFHRLWPQHPGGPVPGPGRPSSPTSPSNILEALTAGRKRTREQEIFYPPNATPPSMAPPTKISIGIGDTPVRSPHTQQMSKRVKFLGPEAHDRPMIVPYSGIGGGNGEPLSSESILEQMNQTEKRFLPDATSTPYSSKKPQSRTSGDSMRKRRTSNSISVVEEPNEKYGKFCRCNECYEDAAGILPSRSSKSATEDKIDGKIIRRKCRETCDKGVGTDPDKKEYFREIFRKEAIARREKQLKAEEEERKTKILYTKELYDRDNRTRVERLYRILKLTPTDDALRAAKAGPYSPEKTASAGSESVSKADGGSADTSINLTSTTPAEPVALPGATPGGGFSFGKQTSPIAHTVTTTACTTITSASLTGSGFQTTQSSSATTAALTSPPPPPYTSTTPGVSKTLTPSTGQMFSMGSGSTLPKPVSEAAAEVTTPPSVPSFGQVSPSTITEAASTNPIIATKPIVTFGGFGASNLSSSDTNKNITSSNDGAKVLAPPAFSFGKPAPIVPNSDSDATTSNKAPFSFGSASATSSFGQVPAVEKPVAEAKSDESAAVFKPSEGSGFSFSGGSSSVSGSALAGSTTGGFSFGKPVAAAAPITTTTATPAETATVPKATTTSSTPAFSFGQSNPAFGGAKPFSATESSSATTGITFGGSSNQTTFGSSSLPTTTTGNTTGNLFGSSPGSVSVPQFGGKDNGSVTTPQSSSQTAVVTTTASSGGFNFSAIPNPLANKPATTTTSTFGQFGSSTTTASASSAFSGLTSASAAGNTSVFGGGGISTTVENKTTPVPAATVFGQSPANAFGSGSTFGASTGSTLSSGNTGGGGFSFGKDNASVAPTTSTFSAIAPNASATSGGGIFGAAATSPPQFVQSNTGSTGGFGPTSTTSPAGGGFSFSSVPNPLVGKSATSPGGGTSSFSTFGAGSGATSNAASSVFGSAMSASSPPSGVFGASSTTSSGGFSFGPANTMSSPQSQSATGGFGSPDLTQSAVTSSGFGFGQSNMAASPPAPASNAVFQFGQPAAQAAQAGGAAAGTNLFQFGQQPVAQNQSGGFNFGAAAAGTTVPLPGGSPMFNMGTNSTAPRRRDIRRRYR